MNHTRWEDLRNRKLDESDTELEKVTETRREIQRSMALARAVYERRVALGLTQAELAERTGLTEADISCIEGSDSAPTPSLLAELAEPLDFPTFVGPGTPVDKAEVTRAVADGAQRR